MMRLAKLSKVLLVMVLAASQPVYADGPKRSLLIVSLDSVKAPSQWRGRSMTSEEVIGFFVNVISRDKTLSPVLWQDQRKIVRWLKKHDPVLEPIPDRFLKLAKATGAERLLLSALRVVPLSRWISPTFPSMIMAHVSIRAALVDASSGKVLKTFQATGESKSASLTGRKDFEPKLTDSEYRAATQAAIEDLAEELSMALETTH